MCRPSLRNSLHCENKDLLALLCSSQVSTCQGFVKVKGIHITEFKVVIKLKKHKVNIACTHEFTTTFNWCLSSS